MASDHHSEMSFTTLSGREWSNLSDLEKTEAVANLVLLSRVEPIHKLEIVKYLKEAGEVVAMTGDGVNDAPALKKADIGISMGSGTSVAKEASDLVLVDDNFFTIVSAVKHGRAIFANTKQFIRYLISSNIGEVCCIFFTAALGIPEALSPVQLLWVNFVTDGLPATALSFNEPEKDSMFKPPRSKSEGIVNKVTAIRYAIVGLYVGTAVVMGFVWWFLSFENGPKLKWNQLTHFFELKLNNEIDTKNACTIALSILVTIEMLNALNSLSENQSLLVIKPWSNKYLVLAICLSMFLHFAILYIPKLADIFGVAPISVSEWSAVFGFSFPVILIDEAIKFWIRKNENASGFSRTVYARGSRLLQSGEARKQYTEIKSI